MLVKTADNTNLHSIFFPQNENRHYKRNVDFYQLPTTLINYHWAAAALLIDVFENLMDYLWIWSRAASFSLLPLHELWVSMSSINLLHNLPSLSYTKHTYPCLPPSLYYPMSSVQTQTRSNGGRCPSTGMNQQRTRIQEEEEEVVSTCVFQRHGGRCGGFTVVFCLCEEKLWTKLIASFKLRLSCLFSPRDLFYRKVSFFNVVKKSVRPRQIGKTRDYRSLIYVSNFQCQSNPPPHAKVGQSR